MSFKNKFHEETYKRVGEYLAETFGPDNIKKQGSISYSVEYGSAIINIGVYGWKESAMVDCLSFVAKGVKVSSELMKFLLSANTKMYFGAFSLADEGGTGDVMLHHAIVGGNAMDKNELKFTVMEIARIADEYDDKIVNQFGGKRGLDAILEKSMAEQ
jgi:hypothetical protein